MKEDTAYEVSYSVNPNCVTVSAEQSLQFYITNYSGSPIRFQNPGEIRAADIPTDFEEARPLHVTHFLVYFYYGDHSGDLTSEDDSRNLTFSLYKGEGWDISAAIDSKKGVCCKVSPRRSMDLPNRESLIVRVDRIKCNRETGLTRMIIELRTDENTANYLNIQKFPKPVIRSFGIKETDIEFGQEITYFWDAVHDEDCNFLFDGAVLPASDQASRTHKITADVRPHILTVENPARYQAEAYYTPSYKLIDRFSIAGGGEEYLMLAWKTRSADCCWLTGLERELQTEGTCRYPISEDRDIYLKARLKTSQTTETSRALTFRLPRFGKLTAKRVSGFTEDSFLCPELLKQEKTLVPVLAVPYAAPGPPWPPDPPSPPSPPSPPPADIYVQAEWELETGECCIVDGTPYGKAGSCTFRVPGRTRGITVYGAYKNGYKISRYVEIE